MHPPKADKPKNNYLPRLPNLLPHVPTISTMILQIGNPTPLFKLITLVKPIKYRFYSLLPELLFYQFFEFSMTYFVFRE